MRRSIYDLLYRFGAPRDGPPRAELVRLVEGGALTPARFPPGRALDLGCGTGANLRDLARYGFEATGIDFSPVASEGRPPARRCGRPGDRDPVHGGRPRRARGPPGVEEPFDLLGTTGRSTTSTRWVGGRWRAWWPGLARPGAAFLLWCICARRADRPRFSLTGPSRMVPVIEPGEEASLFGDAFPIERLPEPDPVTHSACFLMTRH